MLNWHDQSCRRPEVSRPEGFETLCCSSCGMTAPLLVDLQHLYADTSPSSMPDAATTIKLRWPGSITFVGEVPGTSHEHDSPVESQPQPLSAESKGAASTTDRGLRIISVHNDTADACGQEKVFYEPLIAHKIRLLRLSAAERHHDPIHIDIRLTDLTSDPKFEALSYTWADNDGDDSKCDRVYVGKHWDILPVTRNCASALRRLRFPYRERDLWVDAICIDQRNKQERSHQVGIMQYIYAAAIRVLIYLGEDSKDPDSLNPVPWTDGKYIHRPLASPSTLAENPYFRRVWVIQEIAAARDAWVLSGSRGARWHDFLGVTNSETDSNRNRDLSLSIDRPMTREKLPKWLYICNKPRYMELDRLLYVLYAAAQCKASDLRDKVFAILGLFHGANNAKLVADYTLCHQEVAIGVTAYIFVNHTEQMWRIFAAIDSKDSHVMPSWVMDWSSETKVKRLGPYMAETKPIVEAEGKQSQPLYIPRIYRNGSLVLKGRLVTQAGSCAFNHGARDGPPGVVTDIVYQQSIIWHLQSDSRPMVPSGWCQSTDEIFAVQSLSGYCLILRPIMTNPKTYRFVAICKPPKVEPMAATVNLLDQRVILLFSTWRYVLREELSSGEIWYSSERWDMIRDVCQTVKECWVLEDTISRFLDSLVKIQTSVSAKLPTYAVEKTQEALRRLGNTVPKSILLQQKGVLADSMQLSTTQKNSNTCPLFIKELLSLAGMVCDICHQHMTNTSVVDTYSLLGQSLAKKNNFQKRRQPLMNQKIHNGNLHLRTRDLIYWQIASQLDEMCLNRKTLERLEYIARSAERDLPRYLNLSNYTSETYNYASDIKTHHLYDIFHFIIKSIPTTQKSLRRARWE
ncbi:uncharacterized protein CLUP02_00349 [Colletotrichum lupini]|uniref:Heterokaryon incompatibility domain-containing protein n=1 Tax=Colletotrichum lupini TaxID=145971 RepID=A0A9Q8W6X7_9PEZI|nr:uncharacterized protein CLUP02_00349 [Colletotrichum lupini]UQC73703.1 hypothetical protein CLUP02_00349 [Colletotrichum lupini]